MSSSPRAVDYPRKARGLSSATTETTATSTLPSQTVGDDTGHTSLKLRRALPNTTPASPRRSANHPPHLPLHRCASQPVTSVPSSSPVSASSLGLRMSTSHGQQDGLSHELPTAIGFRDHLDVLDNPYGYPQPPAFRHNWERPNRRAACRSLDPARVVRPVSSGGPPIGSTPNIRNVPARSTARYAAHRQCNFHGSTFPYEPVMSPYEAEAASRPSSSRGASYGYGGRTAPDDRPPAAFPSSTETSPIMSATEAEIACADTRPLTVYLDRLMVSKRREGTFRHGEDAAIASTSRNRTPGS
ncbi:hypothetical protein QBC46DRAFT_351459 [Diplogelasinospora grovesii]|uniref:Uncharacterized protein n=1 Tax=Diplogelasinospora grovesii TaxID=303347 RepID=A0AAN6ND58_9PEZI|nr:hypothetical protein QBC46DRAFT_351459 [Diplogelasinospora grovesii]